MNNPLKLINKRALAVLLGAFGLLTLLSVLIIVLTVSLRNRAEMRAESLRLQEERRAVLGNTGYGMEDFLLNYRNTDSGVVYPARESRRCWSMEEVESFWINPADAGLTDMDSRNDAMIFESLGVRNEKR